MPRAVTLSRCTAASQAACCYHFIPSAHSQHQQAPAAGGQGWGPPCRGLRREALARCCQIRRTWALPRYLLYCTCTVLVCWASDGCYLFPISPGIWSFSFPGIRERKMTGIPGRPGNGSPGIHTLDSGITSWPARVLITIRYRTKE